MALRVSDLIAIAVYALAMLWLGWWAKNRIKGTSDYYVGGRSIPGWAVGISMLGTAISSVTFLAYPGSSFAGNWSRLIPGLMLPIATIIGAYFFVVFYRRTLFVSAYQYFEERFGNWGRSYASGMWSLMSVYRMGSILYLMALPIRLITGWHTLTVMLVFGIIITAYTMMGGLEAVIWTDVVQTIILALGGIITVAIVLWEVPGNPLHVLGIAWDAGKFDIAANTKWSFAEDTVLVLALSGIIGNVQEYATDQTKIQRYAAASSDRGALGAIWTVGLGCIPLWSLFMLVGTCLWIFYQTHPNEVVNTLRADTVYPHFIITHMPPFVGGLVISAVLAAAMSSIDSSMNGTATVLTKDFYERHFRPGRSDEHYLKIARILTMILGILMVVVAYALHLMGEGSILDTLMFIGSVIAGGLGGLFLLGFVSNRVNWQGAAIGLVAGVLSILWCTISHFGLLPPSLTLHIHPFLIGVVGNVVVFVVGFVASMFFRAPRVDEINGMTWWTRERRPTAEVEAASKKSA